MPKGGTAYYVPPNNVNSCHVHVTKLATMPRKKEKRCGMEISPKTWEEWFEKIFKEPLHLYAARKIKEKSDGEDYQK